MTVVTSRILRITLRCHGIYFLIYAVVWQFFVAEVGALVGLVPPPPSVIGNVAMDVSAGSMATIGALLLAASYKERLPRFVLIAAIVQTVLNSIHGLHWMVHGYAPALVIPDAIFIVFALVIYFRAYVSASTLSKLARA
jgi:hypothetical protein